MRGVISAENSPLAMEWQRMKRAEFLLVPAIYLKHIGDALTGKRDLNKH